MVKKVKDLMLLTNEKQVYYFSGFLTEDGFLLKGKDTTLFVDDRYYEEAVKTVKKGVIVKKLTSFNDIKEEVLRLDAKELLIDFETVSHSEAIKYQEFISIKDCSKELKETFLIKDKSEIELIKKASSITEKAFYKSIKKIRKGITELKLKNIIENNLKKLGASGSSFDIIVAFQENSAIPHHKAGDRKLGKNEVVLIDMGAVYKGYASDMTRTLFYGKPPIKFVSCYEAVKQANELAIKNITLGMTAKDADAIARNSLKEVYLDTYFTHSLGHGVGLNIHEAPTLSKKSEEVIKEDMVFTIEPGVYFEGEFGIRIEDTVVMQKSPKRLFTDDKKLIIK